MFKKIIFLIFILSFFSTFIIQEKSYAWYFIEQRNQITDTTIAYSGTSFSVGCNASTTFATIYGVVSNDFTGNLPLCFYDANSTDLLTLREDNVNSGTQITTGSNGAGGTYTGGTANIPTKVNYPANYSSNIITSTSSAFDKFFYISDGISSGAAPARFNLTLRPAWKVKFLNKDGAGTEFDNDLNTPRNLVVYNGRSVSAAGFNSTYRPTRTGPAPTGGEYRFNRWETDGGDAFVFSFTNWVTPTYTWDGAVTKFINVKATWTLTCTTIGYRLVNSGLANEACSNLYTVTFDKNGGTTDSNPTTKSVTYNTVTSAPAASPTKIIANGSSTFLGWGETNNSNANFNFTTPITSDKTFYAIWGTLTCNPTYELSASGNSCVPIQTPTPPCGITSTSTPTTNGTACPITMTAATSTNGTQFQGNVVSSLSLGYALKYNESLTVKCDSTWLTYVGSQVIGNGYTGGGFPSLINSTTWATPFNASSTYSYNYGNPNTAYIEGCFNIGATTDGKLFPTNGVGGV